MQFLDFVFFLSSMHLGLLKEVLMNSKARQHVSSDCFSLILGPTDRCHIFGMGFSHKVFDSFTRAPT